MVCNEGWLHTPNVGETVSAIDQLAENVTLTKLVREEVDVLGSLDRCAVASDGASVASALLQEFALFHQTLVVNFIEQRAG